MSTYLSLFTAGAISTKYVGLFIYVYVYLYTTLEDFKTYQHLFIPVYSWGHIYEVCGPVHLRVRGPPHHPQAVGAAGGHQLIYHPLHQVLCGSLLLSHTR